jgi:hypothetical protein
MGVEAIVLALAPVVAPKPTGPVRADLEYRETERDQVLR